MAAERRARGWAARRARPPRAVSCRCERGGGAADRGSGRFDLKLLALGVALVLGASVIIGATTATAALGTRPAGAPALFAWVPPGGFPDRFPFGQCTWWVAFNRRVTWGGDARDWARNARAQGLPTSPSPSVGAIAVYRPGGSYSAFGHVAVVVATAATTYTVSEMNAPAWGRVDVRTIAWPDPAVELFIALDPSEVLALRSPSPRVR